MTDADLKKMSMEIVVSYNAQTEDDYVADESAIAEHIFKALRAVKDSVVQLPSEEEYLKHFDVQGESPSLEEVYDWLRSQIKYVSLERITEPTKVTLHGFGAASGGSEK